MTPADRERYSRQLLFAGIGEEGQRRLLASRVAIVGCGALGSFQAGALLRAGVRNLALIDRDYVEPSNLQRQWLYEESDAREGLPKAIAAARRLSQIDQDARIAAHVSDLNPANAAELLADAALILDGTDNFETRYLINDWAVSRGTPWIYGAVIGAYGISMPVIPGRTCCLECVYPDAPRGVQPTCETAGVVGPAASMVASIQAADAIKLLAGAAVEPRITSLDVWEGKVRQAAQPGPDPDCRACGRREFLHLAGERRAPVSLCGRNAVQIHERDRPIDLAQLRSRLAPLGEVRANDFALRFFADSCEITVFPDGRAIVKGTTEPAVARSLYARYVGG